MAVVALIPSAMPRLTMATQPREKPPRVIVLSPGIVQYKTSRLDLLKGTWIPEVVKFYVGNRSFESLNFSPRLSGDKRILQDLKHYLVARDESWGIMGKRLVNGTMGRWGIEAVLADRNTVPRDLKCTAGCFVIVHKPSSNLAITPTVQDALVGLVPSNLTLDYDNRVIRYDMMKSSDSDLFMFTERRNSMLEWMPMKAAVFKVVGSERRPLNEPEKTEDQNDDAPGPQQELTVTVRSERQDM